MKIIDKRNSHSPLLPVWNVGDVIHWMGIRDKNIVEEGYGMIIQCSEGYNILILGGPNVDGGVYPGTTGYQGLSDIRYGHQTCWLKDLYDLIKQIKNSWDLVEKIPFYGVVAKTQKYENNYSQSKENVLTKLNELQNQLRDAKRREDVKKTIEVTQKIIELKRTLK